MTVWMRYYGNGGAVDSSQCRYFISKINIYSVKEYLAKTVPISILRRA